MSNEKFTKGPWFYEEATGEIYSDNYAEIICDMLPTGDEEFDANAALVAVAPEMYELLQKLRAHYNFSEYCENEVDALLAKARGEK